MKKLRPLLGFAEPNLSPLRMLSSPLSMSARLYSREPTHRQWPIGVRHGPRATARREGKKPRQRNSHRPRDVHRTAATQAALDAHVMQTSSYTELYSALHGVIPYPRSAQGLLGPPSACGS